MLHSEAQYYNQLDNDEEQMFYNLHNQQTEEYTRFGQAVIVREGQVQILLGSREPPMTDDDLLEFCEWLDTQSLPVIVESFQYVLRTGAMVDLSFNRVGPKGIERLLDVLRSHGVPCAVLKAYRNVLDDSVIDPLVEYFHTQPAGLPMQGLHISHNRISAQGAIRLVKAVIECGQYPTRVNKRPFWLRLEQNEIERPEDVVQTSRTLRHKLRADVKHAM